MKRLLLLGHAPLPPEPRRIQRSSNLRTWHFAKPLLDAGHTVLLVAARIPGSYPEDVSPRIELGAEDLLGPEAAAIGDRLRYVSIPMARFNDPRVIQDFHDTFEPDAVIGINSHPAARAVVLDTEVPIWCDLNGWALAEAQTKAATYGDDHYLSHFWNLEAMVLDRADVLSTVSRAQAQATVGELATRGRLNRRTLGHEFCHPIPNALAEIDPTPPPIRLRGQRVPEDAFVVLWLGGYNTWTDVDLLAEALDQAATASPNLHFVSTGGALEGHDDLTFERFRERIAARPWADRAHFVGWVPTEEVESYLRESDLGLNVDNRSYETLFGARNRLNDMLRVSLPILTTLGTEISQDLAERDLALTVELGDVEGFAERLLWALDHRDELRAMGERAADFGRTAYSYDGTTRALLEWAEDPQRAPDLGERVELDPSIDFFESGDPTVSRADLEARCAELEERCGALEDRRIELEGQLGEIHHSRMWHLWMAVLRVKGWLSGSGRSTAGT